MLYLVERGMRAGPWGECPTPFLPTCAPFPALLGPQPPARLHWEPLPRSFTSPPLPQISPFKSQGKRPRWVLGALFSYCSAVVSLQQGKAPHPGLPEGLFIPGQSHTAGPSRQDRQGRGARTDTLLLPKWWGKHHRNASPFPPKSSPSSPGRPEGRLYLWPGAVPAGRPGRPPPSTASRPPGRAGRRGPRDGRK